MDRRPQRSPSLAERTRGRSGTSPHPSAAVGTATSSATGTAATGTAATGTAAAGARADVASTGTSTPQRHCWVLDGATPDVRAPGLLVEWRQLAGAWQGRVAYVVAVEGEATLVEAWVPAWQLVRATPG